MNLAVGVLAAAGVLAIIAIGRNEVYRDPIALWRADVAALPGNYRAQNNLGLALIGAGQMREAILRWLLVPLPRN